MTRILDEYDNWKELVKNLYLTPDEHYDDPKKYFTRLHECSYKTYSRFLALNPEIPNDYVIDFMEQCRGNDCKDNFLGLLYHLRDKGIKYDSQTIKSNIDIIISTSKNSWYCFHTINAINYYLKGTIKIDSRMINNMLSDETSCEQKLIIIKKFVNTSDINFSEVDITKCQCSGVMKYLLDKSKITRPINSADDKGRTPLFRMKSQLELDLLDDPRYSERLRSIHKLEEHGAVDPLDNDNKSYKQYAHEMDDYRKNIRKSPY